MDTAAAAGRRETTRDGREVERKDVCRADRVAAALAGTKATIFGELALGGGQMEREERGGEAEGKARKTGGVLHRGEVK